MDCHIPLLENIFIAVRRNGLADLDYIIGATWIRLKGITRSGAGNWHGHSRNEKAPPLTLPVYKGYTKAHAALSVRNRPTGHYC
jgi:hypothetical protein